MGVDTKGVVVTNCKDVMFVCKMVENALNKLIRPFWREYRFAAIASEEKLPPYALPHLSLIPGSGTVQFHFRYANEQRILWLHFDCDCDNTDMAPKTLSMSMGCWGHSELFIRTALEALSMLGQGYIDRNDCDGEGFLPVQGQLHSFLTACASKLEHPFCTSLEDWQKAFDAGAFGQRTFDEVMGMSRNTAEEIIALDFETAKTRLEALVEPFKPKEVQAA